MDNGNEIVVRDEKRGHELHFKLNGDREVVGVEIFFDAPRSFAEFVNYNMIFTPVPAMTPGVPAPAPRAVPTMPRPCSERAREGG